MHKTFKGIYIPFYIRLLKRLVPLFLLAFFGLYKFYYGRSAETFASFRIYYLIIMLIAVCIGIYYHTDKIRTVVNEVRISDTNFHVIGQDFFSKYEDNLDISKTMLEIQLEEQNKNNRYCLEIYCDDKYYYLNKFNDWDYKTLAAIVDEFQLKTGKSVAGMDLYKQLI